tara:strand:+ start:1838 stop:1984 length:147 start_codon:yes stop_codon:yes gene_type:complete
MLGVSYTMVSSPTIIRINCPSHVDMLGVIQIPGGGMEVRLVKNLGSSE